MSSTQSRNNSGRQDQQKSSASSRTPRRVPTPCQSCFIRKLNCDGLRPQCNWCQRRETPCTYTPVTAQGKRY
ncbi:hypothetical protein DFH06DRAFT_560793 [Mycena polygramma]|nr:hypothetical protein DFH06DRAFT_560793 [Mycena polygramma]